MRVCTVCVCVCVNEADIGVDVVGDYVVCGGAPVVAVSVVVRCIVCAIDIDVVAHGCLGMCADAGDKIVAASASARAATTAYIGSTTMAAATTTTTMSAAMTTTSVVQTHHYNDYGYHDDCHTCSHHGYHCDYSYANRRGRHDGRH